MVRVRARARARGRVRDRVRVRVRAGVRARATGRVSARVRVRIRVRVRVRVRVRLRVRVRVRARLPSRVTSVEQGAVQVGHERANVPERTCLGQMTDVLRHRGVPSLGVVQVDRDHAAPRRHAQLRPREHEALQLGLQREAVHPLAAAEHLRGIREM